MFQDDLLVRSPHGFKLTLRGRKILQELEGWLPKMEHLVAPNLFDPVRQKSHFRISGPDNVCFVELVSHFCRSAWMLTCLPVLRTLPVQGFSPGLLMVTS